MATVFRAGDLVRHLDTHEPHLASCAVRLLLDAHRGDNDVMLRQQRSERCVHVLDATVGVVELSALRLLGLFDAVLSELVCEL